MSRDRAGHRSDVVERERHRKQPAPRDQAVGRLQPDHAAVAGRIADRAAGVGADRDRHHAGGERDARARRRASRMVVGIPGMPRIRERQFLGRPAECKFVQRLLAQHDRAGAAQARDHGGIFARDVVEQNLGVAGGRQPGNVDIVLEAVWHAVQRTERASVGDVLLGLAGGIERGFRVHADERTDPRIVGFDPGDQRLDQFDRRKPARRVGGADFRRA